MHEMDIRPGLSETKSNAIMPVTTDQDVEAQPVISCDKGASSPPLVVLSQIK